MVYVNIPNYPIKVDSPKDFPCLSFGDLVPAKSFMFKSIDHIKIVHVGVNYLVLALVKSITLPLSSQKVKVNKHNKISPKRDSSKELN